MSDDREVLIRAGCFMFGPDWRRPMAAALGPLHPAGPKETIDPRLPARWATGERDIPGWVRPALRQLIQEHSNRMINEHARALYEAGLIKAEIEA